MTFCLYMCVWQEAVACYHGHELNTSSLSCYLSFSLLLTSVYTVVTRVSHFEMHDLVMCCFFSACLLHLTSAHLPVLSDFISHLFYSLSAFFDFVSLSLFSVHLPPFLCRRALLSSPCSLPLSAECIPFALAQLSAACFSCTHTCTHLHICVHAHDSVEESPR